jgi:hypothetical protein
MSILETLEAELASILLADDAFNSSPAIREQCFHAYRILRDEYHLPVPFSLTEKLLGIDKWAVRMHWRRYKED